MSDTIGFGIIGTGSIADFHASAIAKAGGAELRAVTSRTWERARAFAEKNGVEAERGLAAFLARSDIDVVMVATPSGAHEEVAVPALQAGKHVLCEKPLEITLDRIDRMVEAARFSGRILGGIFQSRFGTGAAAVKDAVLRGRFGNLALCSAYVKWWRTQEYYDESYWRGTWDLDGGGALMNQGIHTVDLLQWIAGMPVEVSAYTATHAHTGIEVEDTASASLRFEHGALGVIEGATSCYPGFAKRIAISGGRGTAILEDDDIVTWEFDQELPEDQSIRDGKASSGLKGGASDPRAISDEGHRLHVEDMVKAVKHGSQPHIPPEEGKKAVAIIKAIYESAELGRSVKVAR